MSDIIKDAGRLLDGATPAPWGLSETEVTHRLMGGEVYEFGGEPVLVIGGDVDDAIPDWEEDGPPYFYYIQHSADGELMAAAPELAQALAEETYEYSIQIKDHTGEWETATNSETHLEEWWESKKHAEWAMAEEQEYGEHCRLVRRRVSPPEVIND